ncbi:MAG TPA: HPF/RaiA family ribosome-associated protein [Bacteroidia bacterium]|nr:HPF/RaiA family ribosome-associated protein [Bacteroidia bacterium]
MEITIQSLHFTARPSLDEFVREKVTALEKFNGKILSADVYLKLDKAVEGNKVCELKIALPGEKLVAKKQDSSFEKATVSAVEAMKQQLESRRN